MNKDWKEKFNYFSQNYEIGVILCGSEPDGSLVVVAVVTGAVQRCFLSVCLFRLATSNRTNFILSNNQWSIFAFRG